MYPETITSTSSVKQQHIDVCIVEDDDIFLKFVESVLKSNLSKDKEAGVNVIPFQLACYTDPMDFLDSLDERIPDMVIIDYHLPKMTGTELMKKVKLQDENVKFIFLSSQKQVDVVDDAFQKGAHEYITKNDDSWGPILYNAVKNHSYAIQLRKELDQLRSRSLDRPKYHQIIGKSRAIERVLQLIEKAENSNILTMLTGESGTGKEVVARAIHHNSKRAKQPFIPVNMAAIPKDLIESELFGHEKGAFTGAISKRTGKFEDANYGTIFLDEIGEMDLSLQSKILRILEDKQVTRLGSSKTFKLDLRIIAATNKDLFTEVKEGRFREDLYYRLQGFPIHIPPLRERFEDVLPLAEHFLQQFANHNSMSSIKISTEAFKAMQMYTWPGNVRELKSVIERAALLCHNNIIQKADLLLPAQLNTTLEEDYSLTLEEHKLNILESYLKAHDNNIDLVAKKLDIGRATLYRMIKRLS